MVRVDLYDAVLVRTSGLPLIYAPNIGMNSIFYRGGTI